MAEISGVGFPFRIDPDTGGVQWAHGNDKLRQNVHLILSVRQGERPMLRNFGSIAQALVHNPNDEPLARLLQKQIQESLLAWEPRIVVTSARVQALEGELQLHVTYRLVNEPRVDQLILSLG
jgi:uncharacterized protein